MIPKELSLDTIKDTHKVLSPHVKNTPLIKGWKLVDEILNTNSFFKLEFLQNAGTFKARGVINNILNLSTIQKKMELQLSVLEIMLLPPLLQQINLS